MALIVTTAGLDEGAVHYQYTYVAITGRKQPTVSGLFRLVISLECFIEITPDFLCPFMND